MQRNKIVVIGSGAWGQTLAQLAEQQGHWVQVWSRRSPVSLSAMVAGADIVISAVSMKGVREVAAQIAALSPETILVTTTKGLQAQGTQVSTPAQIWQAAFPQNPVVVLSGPNLAKEIQQGLPAATVVASLNWAAAELVQMAFSSSRFRVYTNPDPQGVELGGTLKNVIAIAVGTCDGLQLGTNAKAALVTRGLAEMIRVGVHWGAKPETFYGLAGLGDLLATCNSSLSRNYQVGYALAQGKSLSQILTDLEGTAEGVNTTAVLVQIAEQQAISVPISAQVDALLRSQITPQAAVAALMLRDSKPEYHPPLA